MANKQRQSVKITDPQKEDYLRLVGKEGKAIATAVRIVASEFNLKTPHHREAVRQMLKKQSIASPRTKVTASKPVSVKGKGNGQKDLNQAISEWTFILARAKRADALEGEVIPELEGAINSLKNKLAAAQNTIKILEDGKRTRTDQELAYKAALQSGDVKPPIGLPGKAKISSDIIVLVPPHFSESGDRADLTYHIALCARYFVREFKPLRQHNV